MTIEKLKTVKENKPPIKVLSIVLAVSVSSITKPGATSIKYLDIFIYSK
ncbi:MAG: hypothetical protein V7687_02235 [Maribacter arcticus]